MSKEWRSKTGEKREASSPKVKAEDGWLKEKLKQIKEIKIMGIKIRFFK